jgi:hypothetical protein
MTSEFQKEIRHLAVNEVDRIAGGVGYGSTYGQPTGFGTATDARLAQEQLLESNYRAQTAGPRLRLP